MKKVNTRALFRAMLDYESKTPFIDSELYGELLRGHLRNEYGIILHNVSDAEVADEKKFTFFLLKYA